MRGPSQDLAGCAGAAFSDDAGAGRGDEGCTEGEGGVDGRGDARPGIQSAHDETDLP